MKDIKIAGARIGTVDDSNNKAEDIQKLCTDSFKFGRTLGIMLTSTVIILPSLLTITFVNKNKDIAQDATAIIIDKDQNKATIFNAPGEVGAQSFEIIPSTIDDGNDTFKYVAKNGAKVSGYIRTNEGDGYKENVKGSLSEVISQAENLIGPYGAIEIINVNNGIARKISKK